MSKSVEDRMSELIKPIDQQIMMCDDRNEILMLACAMLQRVTEILDREVGVAGRKHIIDGMK